MADHTAAIAALERRLTALENAPANRPTEPAPSSFWVLDGLRSADAEAVIFAGVVPEPSGGHIEWQMGMSVSEIFDADWSALASDLAALGHPVRMRILRLILEGVDRVNDLASTEGMGTSGQIYHHLHGLSEAGWVAPAQRGRYTVPKDRLVPLLTVIAAAATRG